MPNNKAAQSGVNSPNLVTLFKDDNFLYFTVLIIVMMMIGTTFLPSPQNQIKVHRDLCMRN